MSDKDGLDNSSPCLHLHLEPSGAFLVFHFEALVLTVQNRSFSSSFSFGIDPAPTLYGNLYTRFVRLVLFGEPFPALYLSITYLASLSGVMS